MEHIVFENVVKNAPHMSWVSNRTVLLVRHGSHAYGTNVETSDEDFKGIAIPPKEYFLGSLLKFEQAELNNPDAVIYDMRKFFKLASDCNPNIIEVLFAEPEDHILVDPIGEEIINHRREFLSKKIKHTFLGYSVSQLKRIKTHKKWIMNPPKSPPTRKELGLPERTLIPKDQLAAAAASVQKELDRFNFDFMENMSESSKIEIKGIISDMMGELKITSDTHWESAARKVGLSDNLIEIMQKEREYNLKKREWDQYMSWKKNRNPARAKLEEDFGYDCYLDDTEFLTRNGWKLYSEIHDLESLATLNQKSGEIEFQLPYERVCKEYSGPIVFLSSKNTECAVTPNHRMWVSKINRQKSNNFSTKYKDSDSSWKIETAESLINNHDSWFHVRVTTKPKSNDYDISDDYLKLLGAYISEGCVGKRVKDNSASVIRITQKIDGKMCNLMDYLRPIYKMNRYKSTHFKKNGAVCLEYVYALANRSIACMLEKHGGNGSLNKHLPFWWSDLSQRQALILLDALLLGDGTYKKESVVYYTASKQLAGEIQAMCISNGIVSEVWGPYKNRNNSPMYHVHIGKEKTASVTRFNLTSNHIKIENVQDRKIVCFSVPNEILITRRNGRVSIQGNTKHAYHLVRLIRMCREVLTTGEVIVKRPDREELLAIRNGAWSYDRLIEFAESEDDALNELYKTTDILPKIPNKHKLDKLCIKLVEKSLSSYSWYNIRKKLVEIWSVYP